MGQLNRNQVRNYLKEFDFTSLFIEEFGWDYADVPSIPLKVDEDNYNLEAIAEKRGLIVYRCFSENSNFPSHSTRRKIDLEVTKYTREHLIIYIDRTKEEQIWQWIRREPGKPLASREYRYHLSQSGEGLIQKLEAIAIDFEEEESLTLPEVTKRTKKAFDVDKVTKKFYEQFQKEHSKFLAFITGITEKFDQEWYASLMLNRLMFVYFIQKKGFLNNDTDYLRNKLNESQQQKGEDKFYSFYRYFVLKLFHDGLGKQQRTPELDNLLGKVPYLNGGLFEVHSLETKYQKIAISDEAFGQIFNFFDQYNWHLDERPLKQDNQINPDVLGYIFEKYINQKQMGAYYTKEDITEYISKNCIIPYLFDSVKQELLDYISADEVNNSLGFNLLQENPNRYIYDAVQKGVDLPLPDDIAKGIDNVSGRENWNQPADEDYALPTEIWREFIARRQRCLEVREKLANGEVTSINDLITYNLNIRQFAEDAIVSIDSPRLLQIFYQQLSSMSILDPTCGSGAFLFAALNILEPLYDGYLERMQIFIEEEKSLKLDRKEKKIIKEFQGILANVRSHINRKYFILKNIMLNNLYGVDIMEEATEICKLRLFLKLASQVSPNPNAQNYGIEPLPDIDFNIRSGNSLVGFANYDQVKKAVEGDKQKKLDLFDDMAVIDNKAKTASEVYQTFKQIQTQSDNGINFRETKQRLQDSLNKLNEELNHYLAREYGIDIKKKKDYEKWLTSHQPFHWFIEFYSIINYGGFNVIIGNPPYLEEKEVDYKLINFICKETKTIHALCIERSNNILQKKGLMSMILPLSLVSTQRMKIAQDILSQNNRNCWYSNYSWRPSKLFETVNRALTIFVTTPSKEKSLFTTCYQKFNADTRDLLFSNFHYVKVDNYNYFWLPKINQGIELSILDKFFSINTFINNFLKDKKEENQVYYRTTGGLYWKIFTNFAPKFIVDGKQGHSTRETWISTQDKIIIESLIAILSSDLFWWWYTATSNCRDLNPYDIYNFPVPKSALYDENVIDLGKKYLKNINKNSQMMKRQQKQTGITETQSFKVSLSKPIIDEIDKVLAEHYGFSEKELDFIINYDIKYRMGKELE